MKSQRPTPTGLSKVLTIHSCFTVISYCRTRERCSDKPPRDHPLVFELVFLTVTFYVPSIDYLYKLTNLPRVYVYGVQGKKKKKEIKEEKKRLEISERKKKKRERRKGSWGQIWWSYEGKLLIIEN